MKREIAMRSLRYLTPFLLLGCALAVVGAQEHPASHAAATPADHAAAALKQPPADLETTPLPGMPAPLDPHDLYAADRPNQLNDTVKNFPARVYVPNTIANTVDVIDPATFKIIDHFDVGREPQHVIPSYDMKTLWVASDQGNSLTAIDPATGKKGATVPVDDPYNLYFTPNGEDAIVAAERMHRLDFRDPHTMKLKYSLHVPCNGVNHMDFSANGRYAIVACEFDGQMLKVDIAGRAVVGAIRFSGHSMPQDVRLSPDGKLYYVADMARDGIHVVDGVHFSEVGFIPTGKGAHGLYVSRDSKNLYITNRGEGSVSVMDLATQKLINKWQIPNGGSPDMGGISADGKTFWVAGRYNSEVYAFDTTTGKLLTRIATGKGSHGLCIFPQPGRYSMGHTGVFR
jgi:DNA-binding beta-propeller fold protein YncE